MWYVFLIIFFCGILMGLFFYFFRDPERNIIKDKKTILSPADGRVIKISDGVSLLERKRYKQIDIFLSLFDVHVIRAPIAGEIHSLEHVKGKFLSALSNKASLENEKIIMKLKNDELEVIVRMIAGFIARKIFCYKKTGDTVESGERIGRIVLGSRVEIIIPADSISYMKVKEGDNIIAGQALLMTI